MDRTHQLELPLDKPKINVDKVIDRRHDMISYVGEATQGFDGRWTCLANVAGMLCIVEIKVTPNDN